MRNLVRRPYYVATGYALVGVAWFVYAVIASTGWVTFAEGVLWLLLAIGWLVLARQVSRRERLDRAMPEAGWEVLTLVRQGRKIEAIRRYRELNPGIGLREAKNVVDEL